MKQIRKDKENVEAGKTRKKRREKKTPRVPTFTSSDGHEGFEKAGLFPGHRHDLDPGLDAVHGVDYEPQTGPPEAPAEHDGSHTFKF